MKATNPDNPEQKYSISYSQELQGKTLKELKLSNYIKAILASLLFIGVVFFGIVVFSGVAGRIARMVACT